MLPKGSSISGAFGGRARAPAHRLRSPSRGTSEGQGGSGEGRQEGNQKGRRKGKERRKKRQRSYRCFFCRRAATSDCRSRQARGRSPVADGGIRERPERGGGAPGVQKGRDRDAKCQGEPHPTRSCRRSGDGRGVCLYVGCRSSTSRAAVGKENATWGNIVRVKAWGFVLMASHRRPHCALLPHFPCPLVYPCRSDDEKLSMPGEDAADMLRLLRDDLIARIERRAAARKLSAGAACTEDQESLTVELEERLRRHWPRKGRTEVSKW